MSRGFRQWGTLLLRLAYLGFAVLPVTLAAWPQVIAYRYPAPGVWDAYRSVAIYPTDVLVALILVCWASGRWLGLVSGGVEVTGRLPLRGRRLSWGAWGIHAAAGVLIVLGLVSVAQAPSRVIASAVVVRLGLGWLLYQFVVLEGHVLRRVVPVFALVLVVQAVVGTAQVIGQSTFPLSWIYPAWSADLRAADPGASVIQAADGIRFLRAYGTFPHPNILGGFAAVVLPLTLGRFGAARGKPQLVIAAAVLLGLSTLVLAFSRGAWLAFAAGLSISGLLWLPARRPRLRLRPLLLLGAASLILVIGLGLALRAQVMARLSVETVLELRSVVERSMLQDYAQGVIAEQPLRGVGAGNYILAVRHRVPPPVTLEPPHNVPLLVAAELGLAAAAAWLALFAVPVVARVGAQRSAGPPLLRPLQAGALTALFVLGLTDHYLWTQPSMQMFGWLVLGLGSASLRLGRQRSAIGNQLDPVTMREPQFRIVPFSLSRQSSEGRCLD